MPLRIFGLHTRGARRALERLDSRASGGVDRRIERSARRIVEAVRKGGDQALLEAVTRHDGVPVNKVEMLRRRLCPESTVGIAPELEAALDRAIAAVERFHRPQCLDGYRLEDGGVTLEERYLPLRRVGLYVPGGRFSYPSTAIMSVVPARLAGVEEIVVVSPPAALDSSLALRQVLRRLEVEEIWGMGGAHAIAALAYGTETIRPVDLIAGPGNVWVSAAKRLVSGHVAVAREAGPSEVVVVATPDVDPQLVAADLLAQAEHDPQALAILVTTDRGFAKRVVRVIEARIDELGGLEVAQQSLAGRSCAFVLENFAEALPLIERLAPEHLQLMGEQAEALADRVRCSGAVFVGASTPTVLGDYVAGPSHVLPTGGTARFASGLGVQDFIRRSHTIRFDPSSAAEWSADAARLAREEGLVAHELSARLRTGSVASQEGQGGYLRYDRVSFSSPCRSPP